MGAEAQDAVAGVPVGFEVGLDFHPAVFVRLRLVVDAGETECFQAGEGSCADEQGGGVLGEVVAKFGGGGLPKGGEVEVGGACAGFVEPFGGGDAGDFVGADGVVEVADQVPVASLGDEAERGEAAGDGGVAAPVGDLELAFLADRVQQHRDEGDAFAVGLVPAGCVDVEAVGGVLGVLLEGAGQGGEEFAVDGLGGVLQAEVGEQLGGLGEEEGEGFLGGEAGQVGLVVAQQAPAAARAAFGDDGDAGGAQGVHVAVDGALGDFETFGEFGGGEAGVGLEQKQDGEQTIGSHGVDGLLFWINGACRHVLF